MRKVPYPHPGEILMEVPQRRIGEIVSGKRAVTADTGLRLSRFFGMSDGFWIGLQADFDREKTKDLLAPTLEKIRPHAGEDVAV